MLRRSTLLPVLAAAASLAPLLGSVVLAGVGVPAAAAAASSAAPASDDAPLSLTIDELTPSSIPQKGKVRISGILTNNSDEPWSAINVHAFISADPITDSTDLAFESTRDPEEFVGERITVPGTFDTIPELAPGASAPYTDRIPVSVLDVTEPGVYWFGVHALGTNASGRDSVADGRARTFLPYVPPQSRGKPIDTALVLPIRHHVLHDPNGQVADTATWVRTLSAGGQLSTILDFGNAAGSRPITYLVDPAVPDAALQLKNGNPARTLVAPSGDDSGGDASASPTPSPAGSGASATASPDVPAGTDSAAVALAWLFRFQQALTGKQVLGLPWGDVDVSAAAKYATDVYSDAKARTGTQLLPGSEALTPAISAPSGHLDDGAIALTDPDTTILVSDKSVTRGQAPSVASYGGRNLVMYASDVLAGGPGPDDPLAPVAMRQRILSEAALRMTEPGRQPLVVVFPPSWTPSGGPDYSAFFQGLDVNWMHLTPLSEATAVTPRVLAPDRYGYPQWQANHEVDAGAFAALGDLTDESTRLQGVLSGGSGLAARIRAESFGDVSYFARDDDGRSRVATEATTGWVQTQLRSISVSGPRRVILSSNTGNFSVRITNGLDVPVSIRLETSSSPPMKISGTGELTLAAGSTSTHLLQASTAKLGVHNVRIALADPAGNPLGSFVVVPVRAAQVSRVIWLIMGVAVALLFAAIIVRLVRRIRGTGGGSGDDDPDPSEPGDGPSDQSADDREPEPAAAP